MFFRKNEIGVLFHVGSLSDIYRDLNCSCSSELHGSSVKLAQKEQQQFWERLNNFSSTQSRMFLQPEALYWVFGSPNLIAKKPGSLLKGLKKLHAPGKNRDTVGCSAEM